MGKNEKLNIEYWYKQYLNKMNLKESRMPPAQKRETKRAFVGGFGMALTAMSEEIASIENIDEAVKQLSDLFDQVLKFMEDEL